ncbi:POK6 protein, partial [Anseranas semipalmata]|nr:POK6 protein [Anseranas semipalmata]
VELAAVVRVFKIFPRAVNIVTDSAYVTGIVQRMEASFLKQIDHPLLFTLLYDLKHQTEHRTAPYFIVHVRSHTMFPGLISERNQLADQLVGATIVPQLFQQARLSHKFYHQSAGALHRAFRITTEQARQIVQSCPDYQQVTPTPSCGVNP